MAVALVTQQRDAARRSAGVAMAAARRLAEGVVHDVDMADTETESQVSSSLGAPNANGTTLGGSSDSLQSAAVRSGGVVLGGSA